MCLISGCGDYAVSRDCDGSAPEGGHGMYWARGPTGWRSHRPLTKVGYKSERGPEFDEERPNRFFTERLDDDGRAGSTNETNERGPRLTYNKKRRAKGWWLHRIT